MANIKVFDDNFARANCEKMTVKELAETMDVHIATARLNLKLLGIRAKPAPTGRSRQPQCNLNRPSACFHCPYDDCIAVAGKAADKITKEEAKFIKIGHSGIKEKTEE